MGLIDAGNAGVATDQTSKRERVRTLLLDPLGFRFSKTSPQGKDAKKAKAYLDRICDDLAYLEDVQLRLMVEMMGHMGEGAARCFWPSFATFRGFAQRINPRPIEHLPELASWFGSIEGPAAITNGVAFETYRWMRRECRPPVYGEERAQIAQEAAENRRRLEVIARRRGAGQFDPERFSRDADDAQFEAWHNDGTEKAKRLIHMIQENKLRQRA